MLESNGSDYCLDDDVFMSHSIVGLFRNVSETSEEANYLCFIETHKTMISITPERSTIIMLLCVSCGS